MSKKTKQQLYKKLTEGDIQASLRIYEEYVKIFNITDFLDRILRSVMYKVGDDWELGKISIAEEHVASNVAQALVKIIMERVTRSADKKKILICVPVGEEHHLGCDVLETYLSLKGFRVYNMGTYLPYESIISFISNNKPDVVLISITLEDNIAAGQHLIKNIKEHFEIPIMVGGYAIQREKISKFDAIVISNSRLEEIPKIIKAA
jgi:methanogenic corrinoid protein MtbC1